MDCWGRSTTPTLSSQHFSHDLLLTGLVGGTRARTRDLISVNVSLGSYQTLSHKKGHCSRRWRFCEWEISWISPVLPPSVIDSGKSWPESTLFFQRKKSKNATKYKKCSSGLKYKLSSTILIKVQTITTVVTITVTIAAWCSGIGSLLTGFFLVIIDYELIIR